jgi:hypothetical protein
MELRNSLKESPKVDPWRSAYSANEFDEMVTNNVDRFWIDLGGEG